MTDDYFPPPEEPKDEPDVVLEGPCDLLIGLTDLIVRVEGSWYRLHSSAPNAPMYPL